MNSPAADSRGLRPGPDSGGRLTAIFSKRPRPGAVKTRLCPPLSPVQASRLAEGMLEDVVARCSKRVSFRTVLVSAPAEDLDWFRSRFADVAHVSQQGEGLGARLARFFGQALGADENRSVVVVGSDQPMVSTETMVEAHRRLEKGADLVLGPDAGGGYYLVGLREPRDWLFTQVRMSSDSMYDETLELARGRGLAVESLSRGYDVDVGEDLERLRADLDAWRRAGGETQPEFPRHTYRCLSALDPPMP